MVLLSVNQSRVDDSKGDSKIPTRRRRKAPHPNSILDEKALCRALEERGIAVRPLHLDGLYQSLHRQHYPDLAAFVENYELHERKAWSEMEAIGPLKNSVSNRKNRNRIQLPKPLLEFLKDPESGFVTVTSRIAQQKTSADGMTTKLAIELHDGQVVESVLMRYLSHEGSRASLCVSSQCGCAMGCTFCATGTMGLSGNLTAGEILEQMVHADRILAREWVERWKENANTGNDDDSQPSAKLDLVRNVVFMGMGEPLDNYSNVVEACRALIHRKRWNLAHGRVTISTVGLVSQIRKLTRELPQVSLALSLHAPNQAMRAAVVPIAAARYPIETLIQALDDHMMVYLMQKKRKQAADEGVGAENRYPNHQYTAEERKKESVRKRAMIEYVMLEGDTSSLECAHQLGKLCENRHIMVNLIPYNQTNVRDKLKCPSWDHMREFQRIVISYGAFCTIRRTMGADIDSACGQLITSLDFGLNEKREGSFDEYHNNLKNKSLDIRDIEDSAGVPMSRSNGNAFAVLTVKSKEKNSQFDDTVTVGSNIEKKSQPSSKQFQHETSGCFDHWVLPLMIATSVSATLFFLSSTTLYLKRSQRWR